MQPVTFTPIGIIRSPYTDIAGMPVQVAGAAGVAAAIELDPAYAAGLRDIAGFSHLILLYHLHLVRAPALEVVSFLDTVSHGIFATRSPARPNPIGLSVVRLLAVAGTRLAIDGVDVVDGTPLLDLKPYVPTFDAIATDRIGWYAGKVERVAEVRADDRFR
ncbi:MAG: tRNA (N6-threonylcarbamoyladenosine(37)-N6)-methyltransferase TrmO [Chloroflexi bacterium]|nr:tRNA (N6-threonylcarbamoyladenosine(37)-N6)-methyltransferase TrmO [Chloroflexota bacterium]